MDTSKLQKFARFARRSLIDQVSGNLDHVLRAGSMARRENLEAIKELEKQIGAHGREAVTEKVAYLWFNRFCALRFMDANHYTRTGILSTVPGQFQPEILSEAKMGHIDKEMIPESIQQKIVSLLSGLSPSTDPQAEVYRLLVVGTCNYYHKVMPYLFERISDYTELLMPEDLLSGNSILSYVRESMTPDLCQNVEIIGWLYQYYISEKKDEVFEGLRKNRKVTPEDIPAATQLFTPHWIVRYLVENSLGRLWMLNHPSSRLIEKMDYYIRPEQVETEFLRIDRPEEIKICDPACGSGHMLVYAFDLLYSIYEEEGYDPAGIPEKILTNNLYGIEIDERAGELAAFALTMKARAKLPRFFVKPVEPNICVLENLHFDKDELDQYFTSVGKDLFTDKLKILLHQFEEADNFGSLIRPVISDVQKIRDAVDSKKFSGDLSLKAIHQKTREALRYADYLSPKYHVVIANPPYMGGGNMNKRLSEWVKKNYPDSKSDLFSSFIIRNTELALLKGQLGYMSPFVWMFISSYEKLRGFLIDQKTITSLVQLEYSGFDGATVPICAFTIENEHKLDFKGGYIKLSDFHGSENQAPKTLEAIKKQDCGWFFRASSSDFKKIPGSPIAYWVSERVREIFIKGQPFREVGFPKVGMQTSNNDRYLRFWFEINNVEFPKPLDMPPKWIKYLKGGPFRKWYGNLEYLLRYNKNPEFIKQQKNSTILPESRLKEYKCTWTDLTSGPFSARYAPNDTFHDISGHCFYPEQCDQFRLLGFANTKQFGFFMSFVNSTFHFQVGDVGKMPVLEVNNDVITKIATVLIAKSKTDWDSYETSWDFATLPLLQSDYRHPSLQLTYQTLRSHWQEMTWEMKRLEEENNRLFIDAYALQDELTPDVPLSEITLTCNPHYRYGEKTDEELEALLLADTIKEFLSYAVGCMFGRYALEAPGLIWPMRGRPLRTS